MFFKSDFILIKKYDTDHCDKIDLTGLLDRVNKYRDFETNFEREKTEYSNESR